MGFGFGLMRFVVGWVIDRWGGGERSEICIGEMWALFIQILLRSLVGLATLAEHKE